jgi:hypothetical protein
MGASFRNIGQITNLAGCDLLTISPELLAELQSKNDSLQAALSIDLSKSISIEKLNADEKSFRYQLNQDAMATEKLSEGIRLFCTDIEKLEKVLICTDFIDVTSYPSSNYSTEPFLPFIINGSILVPSGGTAKDGNAFDEYKELQSVCSIVLRYGATLAEMFAYQKY